MNLKALNVNILTVIHVLCLPKPMPDKNNPLNILLYQDVRLWIPNTIREIFFMARDVLIRKHVVKIGQTLYLDRGR